jgi:hypothetical protein
VLKISVKVDVEQALRKLRLTQEEAKKAIPRALNKTATTARAQAAREIVSAGYGIKVGAIKKGISIRRASQSELRAIVRAAGRPIPLVNYGARQTKVGVSVAVLHGRRTIPGAFIATMRSGHKGIFVRVGSALHRSLVAAGVKKAKSAGKKHGLPIDELFGPSIPSAFANQIVRDALEKAIRERFPQVLRQELNFAALRR